MKPALNFMPDFPYPYFQYGSANSTDIDVIISLTSADMPNTQEERKRFVKKLTKPFNVDWNATLAVFENGTMKDTIYTKAWIDSLNNALFFTYRNHKQFWENPVIKKLKRNKTLAIYKAVRTVLSMLTRTSMRSEIKPILKGIHPFDLKLKKLAQIDFTQFSEFNQTNGNDQDIWKILAFYIGQNFALIDSNAEIYTKQDLVDFSPFLSPFIHRNEIKALDKKRLTQLKNQWLKSIEHYGEFKSAGHFLHCNAETVDMKNEKYYT